MAEIKPTKKQYWKHNLLCV